jgi:hypothetical protein
MNERGEINITMIVAIVLGLGLVASAYLNYYQNTQSLQSQKLMQGQITDLRYQVNQDRLGSVASPEPSPTPVAVPDPTSPPAPVVAGTAIVNLTQLGVKLTVTDPLVDLTYDMATSGTYPVAALSTRSLIAKYSACKPSSNNNALGYIVQKKLGIKSTGTLIKQLGSYNYFYIAATSFCASDQSGRDALAAARAAVKNAALPTLAN